MYKAVSLWLPLLGLLVFGFVCRATCESQTKESVPPNPPKVSRVVAVTGKSWEAEVLQAKSQVLVLFCPFSAADSSIRSKCARLSSIFGDLAKETGEHLKFCKWDSELERDRAGIIMLPAVLLFKDGKWQNGRNGFGIDRAMIIEMLKQSGLSLKS